MQKPNSRQTSPPSATELSIEKCEAAYRGRVLQFDVRTGTIDADIVREVLSSSYYEDVRRWLRPGSVVVDVGGHIGSFAACAAICGAHVVVVEPVPSNFALLVWNMQQNGLDTQVKSLNGAVWPSTQTMMMRVTGLNTGGSSLCYGDDADPQVAVQCYRLNELLDAEGIGACDLLKLDCEGSEFDIIHSLRESTWQRINAVVMEYHEFSGLGCSLAQLQDALARNDFVFMNTIPEAGKGLGYLLAVKVPDVPVPLAPIALMLAESKATRIPIIGSLWRAMRRNAQELVIFYVNQVISNYNQIADRNYVLTKVLTASCQNALLANRRPNDIHSEPQG